MTEIGWCPQVPPESELVAGVLRQQWDWELWGCLHARVIRASLSLGLCHNGGIRAACNEERGALLMLPCSADLCMGICPHHPPVPSRACLQLPTSQGRCPQIAKPPVAAALRVDGGVDNACFHPVIPSKTKAVPAARSFAFTRAWRCAPNDFSSNESGPRGFEVAWIMSPRAGKCSH